MACAFYLTKIYDIMRVYDIFQGCTKEQKIKIVLAGYNGGPEGIRDAMNKANSCDLNRIVEALPSKGFSKPQILAYPGRVLSAEAQYPK